MIRSASVPGSIFSMTVVTPRRAIPTARERARARLSAGRRIARRAVRRSGRLRGTRPGDVCRLHGGLLGLLDEAHRAPSRLRPHVERSIARRARGATTMSPTCRPARRCRPTTSICAARRPARRQPRGDRPRLARPAAQAPPGRGRPGRPGARQAHQCRPRLAERPRSASPLRPRASPRDQVRSIAASRRDAGTCRSAARLGRPPRRSRWPRWSSGSAG